jgi:hypothetical protein
MDSAGSPTINQGFDFNMLTPTMDANPNPVGYDTPKDDDGNFNYACLLS